jgi:hypothetical protein
MPDKVVLCLSFMSTSLLHSIPGDFFLRRPGIHAVSNSCRMHGTTSLRGGPA